MSKKEKKIEAELDYKNVAKNPIRAFPVVFVYFFAIALLLGMYFISQIDTISFNRVPGTSLDTLNVVREIKMKKGGTQPVINLAVLKKPTQQILLRGEEVFKRNCVACHGAQGKGDGPASIALNPKPRNFHVKNGWTNGRTFFDIFSSVTTGVPGTGMGAYEYLPVLDRIAVVSHVMTLTDFPKVTDAIIAKLDAKYKLSNGVVVPAHIPIKMAVTKIVDEDNIVKDKVLKYFSSNFESGSDGYKLFEQYSNSPKKSLPILIINFKSVKTVDEFISSISYSPGKYGFKNSIINLSSNQWNSLFSYFRKISSAVFTG